MRWQRFYRVVLVLTAGIAFFALAATITHIVGEEGGPLRSASDAENLFAEPGEVPIGGPFTLVDHTGQTVTDEDYSDRYRLVFFGYTNCPDVCPTTLGDIAIALDMLGKDARQVRVQFISLDPERDTPDLMAEYVAAFDPRIVGLTGSPLQIAAVASEYRAFYEKVSVASYYETVSPPQKSSGKEPVGEEYLLSHQGQTYLLSPDNKYLTHFNFGSRPEEMVETIRKAMAKFGRPVREKS